MSDEIARNLCKLFQEIAEKEKIRAVRNRDYGTALISAVLEGMFKEAACS